MLQIFPTPTRVSSTNHSHRILPGPTIGLPSLRLRLPPTEITPHRTPVITVPMIPTKLRIWAKARRTTGTARRMQITPPAGHHSPDDSYHTPERGQGTPDAGYGSPDANYTTQDDGHHSPDDSTKPRIWAKARRAMGTVRRMQITPHRTTAITAPTIPTKPWILARRTPGTVRGCKLHLTDYGHHSPDDSTKSDMDQGTPDARYVAGCKLHLTGLRSLQSR